MTRYSLPLSPLFSPTFRVEEPAPHLIRLSVCPSVCLFALFVWFSSKIPRILENVFVANGKRFCTKGRRPLVFRIPIRNVPFSIRYICVSKKHEGRNLTFVPRAEGPWFSVCRRRKAPMCVRRNTKV